MALVGCIMVELHTQQAEQRFWHGIFSIYTKITFMKQLMIMLLCALTSAAVYAQEKSAELDVNINKSDGGASFPWLWIVGAILFVVILVALLSGGGRDRIIEKRTIVKE